jgi:hypothetical protein
MGGKTFPGSVSHRDTIGEGYAMYHHKREGFKQDEEVVISQLERVMKRLQATIDSITDNTQPDHIAEFNVRNSIHILKDVRKTLIHG